jgi:hypothetical protein
MDSLAGPIGGETARDAAAIRSVVLVVSVRQTSAVDTPPRPSGRDNAAHLLFTAQPWTLQGASRPAPPRPLPKTDQSNGPMHGGLHV